MTELTEAQLDVWDRDWRDWMDLRGALALTGHESRDTERALTLIAEVRRLRAVYADALKRLDVAEAEDDRLRKALDGAAEELSDLDKRWCAEREENERLRNPPAISPGATHWEGCWKYRGHHACAIAEVKRLASEQSPRSLAP